MTAQIEYVVIVVSGNYKFENVVLILKIREINLILFLYNVSVSGTWGRLLMAIAEILH